MPRSRRAIPMAPPTTRLKMGVMSADTASTSWMATSVVWSISSRPELTSALTPRVRRLIRRVS
eukprot:1814183-Prymnesium_polylepis.2